MSSATQVPENWIPRQQTILYPHTRCRIARLADYVGYVPVLGSVVGVARITSAVALATLHCLGSCLCFCYCCCDGCCYFPAEATVASAHEEIKRGARELIPCVSYFSDKKGLREEKEGLVSSERGARGNYVYFRTTAQTEGGTLINPLSACYSEEPLDGSAQWFEIKGRCPYTDEGFKVTGPRNSSKISMPDLERNMAIDCEGIGE